MDYTDSQFSIEQRRPPPPWVTIEQPVVPQSLWDTGRALQKVHADGDLVGAFGVGRHGKAWDWKTWLKCLLVYKEIKVFIGKPLESY